jgi:hypothetical protein
MKPWTTWLVRLAIVGTCFLVAGCGGGDIPDASDDGQASTERAPAAGGGAPAAPAPIEGPKVAQGDAAASGAEPSAAEPAAPAQAPEPETPAAAPAPSESQGNSSTAEMLAIATGPSGGSNAAGGSAPAAGDSAAPGGSAPGGPGAGATQGPGGPGGGLVMGPGMRGGGMGRGMSAGMGPMGPGGMSAGPGANEMARQQAGAMAPPSAGGGFGGQGSSRGPGGPGGPGGAGLAGGGPGGQGANDGPADFHSPQGAVRAFLAALKAKDLDRLNESTALRASQEASSSKSRELFKKIFDLNLAESELDTLAEALNGYNIAGENPAKSTARVEVILRKPGQNGAYYLRKVTVRHEKKGWGVLDVAGAMEFKSMGVIRRPNTGTGGGRR